MRLFIVTYVASQLAFSFNDIIRVNHIICKIIFLFHSSDTLLLMSYDVGPSLLLHLKVCLVCVA